MNRVRILIAALAVFASASTLKAQAWNCAWPHRVPVSVTLGNNAYSNEIRIDLGPGDIPADYVFSDDGDDVRVLLADDTTPVNHVVTDWNPTARTIALYIRLPSPTANSTTPLFVYLGNGAVAPASSVATVFPQTGLRLQSRSTTADPVDPQGAMAAFIAATGNIYNSVRSSITGLTNTALGGTTGDFAWCVSAVVEVTPATAGVWEFRYGADFGRGGHLYVRGVELDAQWNSDLWWGGSYLNTAQTLEGAIDLSPGWHRYEALGFEGCCDGAVGWQARSPGGAWQDMNTTNFSLRAARCFAPGVTVSISPGESCPTRLNAIKTVTVVSDTMGNDPPYSLPGSIVEYQIAIDNPGQAVDGDTINLTDRLPSNVAVIVAGPDAFELVDGSPSSGLTLNWGGPADMTDQVAFSTDGADFTYVPLPGGANETDPAISHIRFSPTGTLTAFDDAAGAPSFILRFRAEVR